ncbi:hypothetical protein ULMS_02130 [Patiriisocius marinistellae]|uniref:Lipoprotein n=1 Tax=Patiriisocius marinistellae TaxID=2494560 RepID=A0A5J4FXD2_9FLAO|nr:hypothetical protein [Patiriisocius marinistellae]GEQ84705.1 hypothetical protein ULMS_02130 [Patiriisocius marinistellae]
MKKLILSLAVMGMVLTACGSDDDAGFDCVASSQDISAKLTAFIEDDSNANCLAYRASLQSFVDNGCSGEQAAQFQAALDDLDCN